MLEILERIHKKEQVNDFEHKALLVFLKKEINHLEKIAFYPRDHGFMSYAISVKIADKIFYFDRTFYVSDAGIELLIVNFNKSIKRVKELIDLDKVNRGHYNQQGLSKMSFYNKKGVYFDEVLGLSELGLEHGETTSVEGMCEFISCLDMKDEELYPNKMFW